MIIVAIPVKNNLKWTAPLVDQLLLGDDIDQLWVYDHGSTDETKYWVENQMRFYSKLKYVDASSMKFYEMWNDMIRKSADIGNVKLAILNNDIRLPHMAIKTMADNMGSYKILTIDTERSSFEPIENVHAEEFKNWWFRVGWAFMVDADFWKKEEFAIDPRFKLWYGDDYLYRRVQERGGKTAKLRGVGCDHAVSQTPYENKDADTEEDKTLFHTLWP